MNQQANHRRLRDKADAEKRDSQVQSLGELSSGEKPTIATYENVGGNGHNANRLSV
jgi:hypothetical protein